jgi:hypothetical protein
VVQALDLVLQLLAQLLVQRRQRLVHEHQLGLKHRARGPPPPAAAVRPTSVRAERDCQPFKPTLSSACHHPAPCAASPVMPTHRQRESRRSQRRSCAGTAHSSGTPCRCCGARVQCG